MTTPTIITYSKSIKRSANYNSEGVTLTVAAPVSGSLEDTYNNIKKWVDSHLASEVNQPSEPRKEINSPARSIAPSSSTTPSGGSPFGVINEKQIRLLGFKFSQTGKDRSVIYNKFKELNAYCSFKDGRNNLTKSQFQDLLNWIAEGAN